MPKIDKLILRLKEIVGEAYVIQDPDKLKACAIGWKETEGDCLSRDD